MRIGSLFSGIGGLELGLERAGLGHVAWQCEIDPFCRSVLARHWPNAMRYEDVRTVDATAPSVNVICGGFPCQDVSLAGKRGGLDAPRSGLWHEFARIIEALRPRIVVIENVLGLRTSGLPRVLADLADLGFDAEWADLAASDIGAPHQRRRMFIVATHSERVNVRLEPGWLERACRKAAAEHRYDPSRGIAANATGMRRLEQARRIATERGWARHVGWELGDIARMDDGFPAWVDVGRARKALGNAVVPACAEVIGRALLERVQEADMSGQDILIEQLREELEKAHAASEYQTRRIEHYRTQLDFCERRAEKAERFIATADSEWKARAEKAERERDARPDISAEDARAFMMFKPVPARDSREGPVMHALRAHAAKAGKP